jgi:uncharacterized protein (DUF488 family)
MMWVMPSTVRHQSRVVTIGYEGRNLAELVAALQQAEIGIVVDVRLTPLSRKPGLSKKALAAGLGAANIRYIHLPALGNPKDNRDGYRLGDPASQERFSAVLRSHEAAAALEAVQRLAEEEGVALLCFERDPDRCHRSQVGAELTRRAPSVGLAHA